MTEDNRNPFYVTTPIYYVNDSPHIGHAYTTIACDALARFMRLDGRDVRFTTGTDEHGQKVDKAAKAAGIDPQSFTDDVSKRFRALVNDPTGECKQNLLNCTNEDFIRTTSERHKKAAQELWKRIDANGHIYKDTYGGWYAVRDEAYYGEDELTEQDGKKFAPSGAEVEWVEEESYFFDLSKWQEPLLKLYKEHPDFVVPQSRLNEVKSFVEGGLKDLSISRTTFDWGVPVPNQEQGQLKHVMYVWIDALTNYMTSAGFPDDMETYNKYWSDTSFPESQSDSRGISSQQEDRPRIKDSGDDSYTLGNAIHVVGKDILRFHAIYWPAFLMAAGLPVPKQIVAHGWWTIEGQKMSKSLGNVIAPKELVDAYGLDQVRYYMLRAMPFGNDGDFSRERVVEVVNADLANNIGNLAQRVLSMIQKNCEGKVPEGNKNYKNRTFDLLYEDAAGYKTISFKDEAGKTREDVIPPVIKNQREMLTMGCRFSDAITSMTAAASLANEYFAEKAPWALKKEGKQAEMEAVLYSAAEAIRCIAILLQPFCPTAAAKLLNQLSVPEDERSFAHLSADYALKPSTPLPKPESVFPRLENKKEAA